MFFKEKVKMKNSENNSTVKMKFQRKEFNGNYINIHETEQIILGFTENTFSFPDLSQLFEPY